MARAADHVTSRHAAGVGPSRPPPPPPAFAMATTIHPCAPACPCKLACARGWCLDPGKCLGAVLGSGCIFHCTARLVSLPPPPVRPSRTAHPGRPASACTCSNVPARLPACLALPACSWCLGLPATSWAWTCCPGCSRWTQPGASQPARRCCTPGSGTWPAPSPAGPDADAPCARRAARPRPTRRPARLPPHGEGPGAASTLLLEWRPRRWRVRSWRLANICTRS